MTFCVKETLTWTKFHNMYYFTSQKKKKSPNKTPINDLSFTFMDAITQKIQGTNSTNILKRNYKTQENLIWSSQVLTQKLPVVHVFKHIMDSIS